jgi:hypothetical protein
MILHNFARADVSTGYDASATSVVLATGLGARFPSTFPYRCVWWNWTDFPNPSDDPNREIIEVTGRSTDTLTVVRGKETSAGGLAASTKNTAGKTYRIALAPTAESVVPVGATEAATAKTTPIDADLFSLFDSAASYVRKKLTWANLKATLKAYTDTLYATAAQGAKADTALQPQLAENAPILFVAAGSADGKYSGLATPGTAGATLAFGDLCYLAVADSRWELADADAEATAGGVLLGICVLAAAADGDPTRMLLVGNVRADAAFPTLTIGAPAYVGVTAGDIQVAQPSGTDDVIRVVGHAKTADELFFNPSRDWITHT